MRSGPYGVKLTISDAHDTLKAASWAANSRRSGSADGSRSVSPQLGRYDVLCGGKAYFCRALRAAYLVSRAAF